MPVGPEGARHLQNRKNHASFWAVRRGRRAGLLALDFANHSQYKGGMRNLAQLPPGARARIDGFGSELRPEVGRRLRELGFVDGNVVRCVRRAPFGGPRVYAVSGAAFALEMDVAAHVMLGPADGDDGVRG